MLDFKSFFEGKAIDLSPDMEHFAKETVSKFLKMKWEYNQPFNQGKVCHPKYNICHDVSISVMVPTKESPNRTALADPSTGHIELFLLRNNWGWEEDLIQLIEHELIHLFDPKLIQDKLRNAHWGLENASDLTSRGGKGKSYYISPWEQDAEMRADARARIKRLFNLYGDDWNSISQSIKQKRDFDDTNFRSEWRKDPKIFQKYLHTLYDAFNQMKSKQGGV